MNVVAYCRYSSDNQREESIDAQKRAIEEYCVKNNYNLVNYYIDAAVSGTTAERENFTKLIKDSKNKNFEAVIVHKFDRFARNRYDHVIFEKKLNDNGVKLLSVLEQLNDSPEAVILKSVLTGMNEYYSLNLAREVRKGQKENALKALHNGGQAPLGYDVVDKEYKLNVREADIVKKIFEYFLQGLGYNSIALELNAQGLRNKRGREFRKTSIRDILLNEKYIGNYVFGKKDKHGKLTGTEIRIENSIPAIIDKDIFYRVQKKMNSRIRSKRTSPINDYLLSGFCTCAICGGTFTGGYRSRNRNGSFQYGYQCINRKLKKTNCNCKPIEKNKLENIVLVEIMNKILSRHVNSLAADIFNRIKESKSDTTKLLNKVESKINTIKNKMKLLLDKYLEGILEDIIFQEKNKELKEQLAHLEIERAKYINSVPEIDIKKITSFLSGLKKTPHKIEVKKALINAFVHRIEIGENDVKLYIKHIPTNMECSGGDDGN